MMAAKHWIFIGVVILALVAGIFVYPDYVNKGIDFLNGKLHWQVPHVWTRQYTLGLDLEGGVELTYQADLSQIADANKAEAMQGLRDVIERRVNLYGVSEPVVEVQG